jgi:mannose-6-phosphate isomerase-like protein (cupin superfamily)
MRHIKSEDIHLKETPAGEHFAVLVGRHASSGAAQLQTVAMVVLPPHKSSDPHYHKEREESYYFLSGQGTATIGDSEVNVKAGDLIFTSPGEKHQFRNTGGEELKYLVFTNPQWVPQDSFS